MSKFLGSAFLVPVLAALLLIFLVVNGTLNTQEDWRTVLLLVLGGLTNEIRHRFEDWRETPYSWRCPECTGKKRQMKFRAGTQDVLDILRTDHLEFHKNKGHES